MSLIGECSDISMPRGRIVALQGLMLSRANHPPGIRRQDTAIMLKTVVLPAPLGP